MFTSESSIRDYIKSIDKSHELVSAMNSGNLAIFIGAGVSSNYNLPSWSGFASKYLEFLYKYKEKIGNLQNMNYKTFIDIPKDWSTLNILSVCHSLAQACILNKDIEKKFEDWFLVKEEDFKNCSDPIYEKIYDTDAVFITTNYDNFLDLMAAKPVFPSIDKKALSGPDKLITRGKAYDSPIELSDFSNLKNGDIVHIHGSVKSNKYERIISREDYIRRYYNSKNKDTEFLEELFKKKIVLFVGYGLSEIEILQFLFETNRNQNHYLLLDSFPDEFLKLDYYESYFFKNYKVHVIPYDKTEVGYSQIIEVFDHLKALKDNDYPTDLRRFNLQNGMDTIMNGDW